jgi:tetratricopeptide (TPR) repeat protein
MELLMRLTPIALTVALALATMASAGHGQKPDDQVDPRSVALTQEAQALHGAAKYQEATDLLETALAVDPRNRQAYIGLARVAQSQKLPGKAIGFYNEALKLEPTTSTPSPARRAYVQRGRRRARAAQPGACEDACANPCAQANTLAAVIAKGPRRSAAAQAPVTTVPPPRRGARSRTDRSSILPQLAGGGGTIAQQWWRGGA